MIILTLKELREKANLSYQDIMNVTHVGFHTVKAWESGAAISHEHAKKIMNLAWPHFRCCITYWASTPDDCLFVQDLKKSH